MCGGGGEAKPIQNFDLVYHSDGSILYGLLQNSVLTKAVIIGKVSSLLSTQTDTFPNFLIYLFNDAVLSNDRMINEMETIWKDVAMACERTILVSAWWD